ncbi:MAG: ROK family protein, partial [Pseudomonadota bacterium]
NPRTGLVRNANSTWLNGRPFEADLAEAFGRPVRAVNDANCLALSEATDGAAAGASTVFAVILGTGTGAGVVVNGRLHEGAHGIAGEYGHMPLPIARADEFPGPVCYCGRRGCVETWISGPALAEDFARSVGAGDPPTAAEVAELAATGDGDAEAALARHADRLARSLAVIQNTLDPEVIVLGGGLSNMDHLYRDLPGLMARDIFADEATPRILRARWGDSSGVRGAARLWQENAR